jgi:hypothetical protein
MRTNDLTTQAGGPEPVPTGATPRLASSRIWWTLLLTVTLALTAAGTRAELRAPSGQSQEQPDAGSDAEGANGRPRAIVGSWFGTTPTGFRQLITFHADGTVIRSVPGEVSTDPARPPHTAAHGVWQYLGNHRFGVTIWDIFYDVNTAQLRHYMRLRQVVTLDAGEDEASSAAVLEVIDANGVVLSSRTGALRLARIRYEPLE